MKTLRWWLAVLVVLVGFVASQGAVAGPPPMDPKQMSGISRPDPQVEPGSITVRCLGAGGFADPAVGASVSLELQSADGATSETRTAQTEAQGRATFTGLDGFIGGKAVASVELGGVVVKSGPIPLLADTGSRVMLVEGATAPPTQPAPPKPDIPAPGTAFPMEGRPAGTLTVGTFDLGQRQPLANIEVKLEIAPPTGEPTVRTGTSDANGKVEFEQLLPPAVPEGTQLTVEATLVPGGELRRSAPFIMSKAVGMALVLAEGAESFERAQAEAAAQAPQKAPALPGPRRMSTLPVGTVRVRVVDRNDQPVTHQAVSIIENTAGGGHEKHDGKTGPDGLATIEVGLQNQQDALYFVSLTYDGAPFKTPFFRMDKRGGVAVDLRVYEVTSDPSVVRSAVQYDIQAGENDRAQIIQIYEVIVEGDKAFWSTEGLKIEAMEGGEGLVVLRPAEDWLDHKESAPFAQLAQPIPPGELANLSIGYLVSHDGRVDFSWTPPFAVVDVSVLVSDALEFEATGAEKTDRESRIPDKTVYSLGARDKGQSIAFSMSGLDVSNPIYRRVGIGGAVVMVVAVIIGMVMTPRQSARVRLMRRRDELLALLEQLADDSRNAPSRAKIIAALDRIFHQLRALERLEGPPPPAKSATKEA